MTTRSIRILEVPVSTTTYSKVLDTFDQWIRQGQPRRTVCVAPVHSLMVAQGDPDHFEALASADLVTADGMPVVWAQRILGHADAARVYGPTLMWHGLERAARENWKVALYGGSSSTLSQLLDHVKRAFPTLQIVLAESPPFRALTAAEEAAVCSRFREAEPDVVWVGLGCPKQEGWMLQHRETIPGIKIGVGAAFDFHAGVLRQAPRWIQSAGLEWLFRWACEPRRLFWRYFSTNPVFVARFLGQALRHWWAPCGARKQRRSVGRGSVPDATGTSSH